MRALDGARFVVGVDKWGNTGGPVDSHGYDEPERNGALTTLVQDMHEKATGHAVSVTLAYC